MHSLMFSLEASLLAPLLEFALSPSGHVEPRRGLALGWLGSVVAGLAVVFGTADRAQADDCIVPEGSCQTVEGSCWCPPPINTGILVEVICHKRDPHDCRVVSSQCWC